MNRENEKILSNLYYYSYTGLSVLFIIAMLGGFLSGAYIPVLELGIIGILINPRLEEHIRICYPKYPKSANVIILIVGLGIFMILL